jgi:hypothetical protein
MRPPCKYASRLALLTGTLCLLSSTLSLAAGRDPRGNHPSAKHASAPQILPALESDLLVPAPNGRLIALGSTGTECPSVRVLSADATGRAQVVDCTSLRRSSPFKHFTISRLAWAASSRYLAVELYDGDVGYSVAVIDFEGHDPEVRSIKSETSTNCPAWSQSEDRLYLTIPTVDADTADYGLYVYDPTTNRSRKILTDYLVPNCKLYPTQGRLLVLGMRPDEAGVLRAYLIDYEVGAGQESILARERETAKGKP